MLAPIILGNDKTTVSVATGQNDFYPVYLSIGNVHNNVRRAHRNAVVIIAFLAIPKGTSTRAGLRLAGLDHWQLFCSLSRASKFGGISDILQATDTHLIHQNFRVSTSSDVEV